MGDVQFAVRMK